MYSMYNAPSQVVPGITDHADVGNWAWASRAPPQEPHEPIGFVEYRECGVLVMRTSSGTQKAHDKAA